MSSFGAARLDDMVSQIQRIVQDTSTARTTDIKNALNRAYDAVSAQMEWPQLVAAEESGLRSENDTLATFESGDAFCPLPQPAVTLRKLILQDVSAEPIEVIPAGRLFELAGSGLNDTGRPRFVAVVGTTAQSRPLAATGAVNAYAETNSSNDNVYSIVVEYRTANASAGMEHTEVVSGAFSTGVTLSANVVAGYSISKVSLPVGWRGNLVMRDGSGNTLMSIKNLLLPGGTTAATQHQTIARTLLRVWPVPDMDYAATIVYQRKPVKLTLDGDTPEIPVSSYLVEKVASDLLFQENKAQLAMAHDAKAGQILSSLMRQSSLGPVVAVPRHPGFLSATGVHPAQGGW